MSEKIEAAQRVYRAVQELNEALNALPENVYAEVEILDRRSISKRRPVPLVDITIAEDIPKR